jgi:uncharacterized membrane-anchored protein
MKIGTCFRGFNGSRFLTPSGIPSHIGRRIESPIRIEGGFMPRPIAAIRSLGAGKPGDVALAALVAASILIGASSISLARETPASPAPEPSAEEANPLTRIQWQMGPTTGKLGDRAELSVPEGFAFADADGARKLLEATQNIPSGTELGVVIPMGEDADQGWFLIFEFSDSGYVKDDERDKLDADALLKTLREGTTASNKTRTEKGYPALELTGWAKPPFYDPKTNNLTWATVVKADGGGSSVNYSTRLLGRSGYMNVDLVISPELLDGALPSFDTLISGFNYNEGHRYAEFKPGDRVATYGLAALVVGGAGAVALKTGLLARFWKVIVAVGVAAVAGLRKFFRGATSVAEMPAPGPGSSSAPRT